MYVEQGDPPEKQRYRLTDDDTKGSTEGLYDAVDTLSQAQANLARSTKVLEEKIEDKSVFLDIIKQMQLPAVQVSVRTIEEEEQLKNMTYRDVTLRTHLPDFRRLNPNANEQTRTLAAFMYFVLYEQITGLPASQMGCATEFRCQTTPFKRLVTEKKQARQTRQDKHHKVGKELRRGSSNGKQHPGKEKESHTKGHTKSHSESHTTATQQKRPRQRQRTSKQVRLSKILKTSR